MNVKDLKEILQGIDDDAKIVLEGFDHSYRLADVEEREAAENHGDLYEYYGPQYKLEDGDRVINVLVFR